MYTHDRHEFYTTNSGVVVTATGAMGNRFTPGTVPHVVRTVGLVATTAVTSGATVKARKFDIGSSGTLTTVCAFSLTSGNLAAVGDIAYRELLNQEVQPGEALEIVCTSASAGTGAVKAVLMVEPRHERMVNVSGATSVTA